MLVGITYSQIIPCVICRIWYAILSTIITATQRLDSSYLSRKYLDIETSLAIETIVGPIVPLYLGLTLWECLGEDGLHRLSDLHMLVFRLQPLPELLAKREEDLEEMRQRLSSLNSLTESDELKIHQLTTQVPVFTILLAL